jgi:hypothetical protein
MKFQVERTGQTDYGEDGYIKFSGTIPLETLKKISLSTGDTLVLNDIDKNAKGKASDLLLGLELIFRRYEEQNTNTEIAL